MSQRKQNEFTISGYGLGLELEPTTDEWETLTASVSSIIKEQLLSLDSSSAINPEAPKSEHSLENYLHELFSEGFNPAHPGFMAYIPGGGLVTSALADWIIKSLNRYGTAYFAAPKLAELELEVIQTFARWVGFPDDSGGVITTGGSVANFTAVVTARRSRLPENFLKGVIYCSDQVHHSVTKAASLAGFPKRNIRILPSDSDFRLMADTLEPQVEKDQQSGLHPFLVVASAGTTNTGSIDPLEDIGRIAANHGLWYHIDAAYGGAFTLTQRGKTKLSGIELADSITLDPHKSMFLPYGTGSILVKDRLALIEAHEIRGDYMPEFDRSRAHLDPFSLSLELSREHRGLKMWLPLILHGEQSFCDALDEKLDLIQFVANKLADYRQISLLNSPDLTTIAFRLKNADDENNKRLLEEVIAGGKVYLSGTTLDGAFALRLSILSHRTHRRHVDDFFIELERSLDVLFY